MNVTAAHPCPPFIFIGNEAFGISNFKQRPYAGININEKKRTFNYRLSRTRIYIECSFGIMANKWRILISPFAEDIVRVCFVVLHNWPRKTDSKSSNSKPTAMRYDLQNKQQNHHYNSQRSVMSIRDTLADFVCPAGELSWQE